MLPQDGSGGRTPTPRNDSPASSRIASASPSVAATSTGGIAPGRMSLPQHARGGRAERRGRVDAGGVRSRRVSPRTSRAIAGQPVEPRMTASNTDRHGADGGEHHQQDDHARQRESKIDHARQCQVRPATTRARREAEHGADDRRHDHGDDADRKRHARAHGESRKDVAGKLIGAEPMGMGRGQQHAVREVAAQRIRRDHGPGDRNDREEYDAAEGQPAFARHVGRCAGSTT